MGSCLGAALSASAALERELNRATAQMTNASGEERLVMVILGLYTRCRSVAGIPH